jgi:hypothetical protein
MSTRVAVSPSAEPVDAGLLDGFIDAASAAPVPAGSVAPPPVPGAAHAARSAVSVTMPAARRIRFMEVPPFGRERMCFTQVIRAAPVPGFDKTKHC